MSTLLPPVEIATLQALRSPAANPMQAARERMHASGQWSPRQLAGRRWNIACVSLEITQRCNLDCTLCYLSDSAEAVRDFPMEEIFRRIDLIHAHYGANTDVQISGGEPTLRKPAELVAIVQKLAGLGMRSALFTNGIKASRALLAELAQAGLTDVAFHVDSTQQRAGYASEAALNALRLEYIERARGLPLAVFFNTTVHDGNWADVPMLAAFFVVQAEVVRFCSFQLQADTGRGVQGARADAITHDGIWQRIAQGAGTPLRTNVLQAGHHDCNRNAVTLVVNGRARDVFADSAFVQRFMRETANLHFPRSSRGKGLRALLAAGFSRPRLALHSLRWLARQLWLARSDLWSARGKAYKLTFFTHNFMDACQLQQERLDACVFMAMTQDGPLSMCAYNARRDNFLLQALPTSQGLWQPLVQGAGAVHTFPVKLLKGRRRAERAAQGAVQTTAESTA
ncbi:MAG: radical SAM protein [Burkholderiaceae bacterium]